MDDDVWNNEDESSNQKLSKNRFEKDLEKLQEVHTNVFPRHYAINL